MDRTDEWRSEETHEMLLDLARSHPTAGILEALGEFRRPESVPFLIEALEDDFARPAAEDALRKLGSEGRQALLEAATTRSPSRVSESRSSLLRRRSAVLLLFELECHPDDWAVVRGLLGDADLAIVSRAAKLGLALGDRRDRAKIICRLLALMPSADWSLQVEIESLLAAALPEAASAIDREISRRMTIQATSPDRDRILQSLLRIRERQRMSGCHET